MPQVTSDETAIWRYMNLEKFIAMLSTRSLWYAKAAYFEDGYECFCEVVRREMPAKDPFSRCITRTMPDGKSELISLSQMMVELSGDAAERFARAPEHVYVNSWCLARESMAMWQIYGSAGSGIAVKSSICRFQRSTNFPVRKDQFAFDSVEYDIDVGSTPMIDLRRGSTPIGSGVWCELLKIAFHKGCNIEVDLDELVSEVYLGPRASRLTADAVASVMDKFGLQKPLTRSGLLTPPDRSAPVAAK